MSLAIWKEWCSICRRKHLMAEQTCGSCGVNVTAGPVSEAVAVKCYADYDCDGCVAYRDHQR